MGERWRIITLHQDNNLFLRQIAGMVNYSFTTVQNIIQLFQETDDVLEREGRERHRLINGLVRRHFRQIMSQHSSDTSLSIAGRLEQRSGVTVSPQTIREACRNENYHPVHARIHWQINEQQAANRSNNWQNVIFSDEKNFQVDETDTVYWIPIGMHLDQEHLQVK
ncbi:unnamed protein product [Rotaria sp. Silwood1]|nr:unnamed protein product [Rotaria sp. Silwood1]